MDNYTQFANPDGKYKLTINETAELPFHRLPFVGFPKPAKLLCRWNVPDAGAYFGGGETGKQLAKIYLKYLLDQGLHDGGMLQNIVLDMFDNGKQQLSDARRGQVVGFLAEIDAWLMTAVSVHRNELKNMDVKAVIRAAEGGLNFDEPGWYVHMGRAKKKTEAKTTAMKKKKV